MTAFWTTWLLIIAASFALAEGFALSQGRTTLSRYVWNLTRAWPPLPFVAGLMIGFVAAHFWWGGGLICY